MDAVDFAALARGLILYAVFPVWVGAAFADWLCHRRSAIERTSGWREAALHWLLLIELAVPAAAVALLEVNALVVCLMLGGWVLHELTTYADLRWATGRRRVSPAEQMVHNLFELAPVVAGAMVLMLHWPAVRSLLRADGAAPDFGARLDLPQIPPGQGVMVAGVLLLFVALPYAEELARCLRVARAAARARQARGHDPHSAFG
ncbi:MAG TPA: diguanylate cyclase [Candidatus Binatia bacterium]|nr:diguanylate cyclase [Candidatus Binatia bacterium]